MQSPVRLWIVAAASALMVNTPTAAWAGSKVTLGRQVSAARQVPLDQVSHTGWNGLLEQFVDARGNVAYARWKKSASGMRGLETYLHALSAGNPRARAGKSARIAFWINAYNAVTIRGILREYPTSSIRNHTARLFGYNIWHDLLLVVGGQSYSLHQIEHDILRKTGDPRIHFGIVCASQSCPRLRNRAYTADRLEPQLVANAKDFFAQPGNFQYDARQRRMRLSSILRWFADDFGDSQAERLRSIAPYLPTREAYDAAAANRVSISYLDYDWGLNDQGTARTARRE